MSNPRPSSNPNPPSQVCPKCRASMEFGLLIDSTSRDTAAFPVRGREQVLEWIRGEPRRSWFDLSFKSAPEDRLQVATLRCTACGFLELYAP